MRLLTTFATVFFFFLSNDNAALALEGLGSSRGITAGVGLLASEVEEGLGSSRGITAGVGLLAPEVEEAAVSFTSRLAKRADDRHPFWVFEWGQLLGWQVFECVPLLFCAGMLCSAGGIGGGGVYVTVLMVAGRLTPRDAVPLSKAVVFFGSMSSLALNRGCTLVGATGRPQALIDSNICRLVVPASLLGTLFGVVINRNVPDLAILLLLSCLLVTMTAMVAWTTWDQCREERRAAARAHSVRDELLLEDPLEAAAARRPAPGQPLLPMPSGKGGGGMHGHAADHYLGLVILAVVVVSGVVRHHASACLWELEHRSRELDREAACRHPTLQIFVGDRLEGWMGNPWGPSATMLLTLLVPLATCLAVMAWSSASCVSVAGWSPTQVAKFQAMAMFTGCLAGLVGIGGGLIFSPFFLLMGVEPAVAVATSSTCVIFTASSTTLQYLLTDRIIVSLTVVYGLTNLLASYLGTAFVHLVQARFSARRSYITAIVAAGVAVSAALSLAKLGGAAASAW